MNNSHKSESEFRYLPTVEVYSDKDDKWHWRIKTPDNKIMGASVQSFDSKPNALKNLRLLSNMASEFCERGRKKK